MEGLKNPHRNHPLKDARTVDRPLSVLRGVGPARAGRFERKGILTVGDLLFHTPSRYDDRKRFTPIHELRPGVAAQVRGTVVSGREIRGRRGRKPVFRIVVRDRTGELGLVWFRYRKAHLERLVVPGGELTAWGRVQSVGGSPQIAHPEVHPVGAGTSPVPPGIHAVYPAVDGIPDGVLRSAVHAALDRFGPEVVDPVPRAVLENLSLPPLAEALERVHRPSRDESPEVLNRFETPAQLRLLFDRFLGVMLSFSVLRPSRRTNAARPFPFPAEGLEDLENRLPFRFTPGQRSAVRDLMRDMARERPMQRLVMGDVGCGKTAVAAAAVHLCVRGGAQAAVMAPTRLLAEQHAETFHGLSEALGLRPGLFTGGTKGPERRRLLDGIRSGEINLVIGTHTLAREGVTFKDLGLAVIDEQQRFGVRARTRMAGKGESPHLLVLTATPIPRTLAMTAYGDLDISLIEDRPEGRLPVTTRLVEEDRKRDLARFLAERMEAGEQVIVVCPAVEASEERGLKDAASMAEGLERLYGERYRVGLVHGRLPEEERLRVVERFRRGDLNLLVATTVIEVGMHVPNATVMVIEHPERFGLAQLHQLRGRVGRGHVQGTCCLVRSPGLSERGLARLKTLVEVSDGFRIAEQDLLMRGQGELTGWRQAGPGDLDLEEVLAHPQLLRGARRAAEEILRIDPELGRPEHAPLRRVVDGILERTRE